MLSGTLELCEWADRKLGRLKTKWTQSNRWEQSVSMERLQLQRNHGRLMTVCSAQDTLSYNTQVTPPDICHCHSNPSLVICLEFPAARAPWHTHATNTQRWFRKASCSFGAEKNVKGKRGMRDRLNCGFHCELWVMNTREGRREKKRETILGWLPWQHNKQKGGRYLQGCFHSSALCVYG